MSSAVSVAAGLTTALAMFTVTARADEPQSEQPLAGYHDGLFYLRDRQDDFRLYLLGEGQLDFYGFVGPGVPKTNLKPTLFLRRVRAEVSGEILGHWHFFVGGDFGATALQNPQGTNETFAASPAAAPTATTGRYASAQTTLYQASAQDVFVGYRAGSFFNVLVGQMDAPFTMENRTSQKFYSFMERSLAGRDVGVPTNKEIGAIFFGETKNRLFYYSVGPYMGDGQNRPNVDSRFDLFARTFVRPFATTQVPSLEDLQLGASVHYGSRDKSWVSYDYPSMSTQGAYTFWSPIYTGADGRVHILPAGDQLGLAGELRIPIDPLVLSGEVVYIDNGTREIPEAQPSQSLRFGRMKGVAYYAMLGIWAFGGRKVIPEPGYETPPRLDWSRRAPVAPTDQALEILFKWEQVALTYASASRSGTPDPQNIDGDIKVNAFSAGVNYWATRHIRLSLDYVFDMFPSSAPVTTPTNRAQAPGNTLAAGVDDSARESAHTLHELLARFQIAL